MVIQSANLALRCGLELCALGALGYWPFQSIRPLLPRLSFATSVVFVLAST